MATLPTHVRETARQANELLRDLGRIRRNRSLQQARLNARLQATKDRYGPSIEELAQQEAQLSQQLAELILPKFALLAISGSRTIKLRSGEISLRRGREALAVTDDEAVIIRRIAARGRLRQFTRLGKRSLNREALKQDPAFVARIKGLDIIRSQSLVIKPARAQGEIVLSADALRVSLPAED